MAGPFQVRDGPCEPQAAMTVANGGTAHRMPRRSFDRLRTELTAEMAGVSSLTRRQKRPLSAGGRLRCGGSLMQSLLPASKNCALGAPCLLVIAIPTFSSVQPPPSTQARCPRRVPSHDSCNEVSFPHRTHTPANATDLQAQTGGTLVLPGLLSR
ncbi:hypothetical protein LZ31DRAFT_70174 [Colletotrichum somersetense]|nr:hypothetical protein LZ31DRAFT_70174 [Colletotrichum somersetense]